MQVQFGHLLSPSVIRSKVVQPEERISLCGVWFLSGV